MSICKGIGNGIGGALGKWGAGLGSALGLGAVVDTGVRAYTGYGLLEILNVKYIECSDGNFATAMEWYGSGLKCPQTAKKTQLAPSQKNENSAAEKYAEQIEGLGGSVGVMYGAFKFSSIKDYTGEYGPSVISQKGQFYKEDTPNYKYSGISTTDEIGNVAKKGFTDSSSGYPDSFMFYFHVDKQSLFRNYTIGNLRLSFKDFQNGFHMSTPSGSPIFVKYDFPEIKRTNSLLGIKVTLPSLPFAPSAASIPPPSRFAPNPPSPPEECQMSCPCITPEMIEKAVKKALGLAPFSPEKIIRDLGAKIYAAPGPSAIPIVPSTLVEAIAGLVATTYMRAGYGRYPVIMPSSLINDDGVGDVAPSQSIENFAEWFEWSIKQQDAIQGEWPIDIAIVDGAKRQPLKFENISEAFSEITGLLIQTATDADAAVNAACTSAVAATKATNAAIVAQKNVECLIRFFGIRTGFKSIFVQSQITPADPDDKNFNIRKFLTPSGQNLAHLTDQDPFDFQAVLDRILRNTEINRASVARSIDKDGLPGDFARNQRKYDASESRREAEKGLEKLEQSIRTKNPEIKVKIKIDTPASDVISGSNFVIKRPVVENE